MDENRPARISRRAALHSWIATSASLTLLALIGARHAATARAAPADQGGPAPAQVPSAPAGSGPGRPGAATPASAPVGTGPAASLDCVLTREQTEGPYYIDAGLIRSDITEGKDGVPLALTLAVLNATNCRPIPNATVEIWHCDAAGDYSGFSGALPDMLGEPPGSDSGTPPPQRPGPGGGPPGPGSGPPPGGPPPGGPGGGPAMRDTPTNDIVFLRGGQVTDAAGAVTFQTNFPGWYRGRTVHIHLKVHVGGNEVHTSQLFFEDDMSDWIFSREPYDDHPGRDTMNDTDSIFLQGGRQGLVTLTPEGSGYVGAITLGVTT